MAGSPRKAPRRTMPLPVLTTSKPNDLKWPPYLSCLVHELGVTASWPIETQLRALLSPEPPFNIESVMARGQFRQLQDRQDESAAQNSSEQQSDSEASRENVTTDVTTPSDAFSSQADEQLLLVIERWADLPPARRKMIATLVDPPIQGLHETVPFEWKRPHSRPRSFKKTDRTATPLRKRTAHFRR